MVICLEQGANETVTTRVRRESVIRCGHGQSCQDQESFGQTVPSSTNA